jgi:hypothetical protein
MSRTLPLAIALAVVSLACSEPTKEPEPAKRPPSATAAQGAHEGSAEENATTDAPLLWDVPAGWSKTEASDKGPRRAEYSVPRVGDDKEDTELLALYFGKGKNGERDTQWDAWLGQFDGDAKRDAKRETFEVGDNVVEVFEHVGNYKLNMGPQRPGMTRSPVQMVKPNFRMLGAVVRTKSRGNWFFRMVGPDPTVTAQKDAFLEMLKSVR